MRSNSLAIILMVIAIIFLFIAIIYRIRSYEKIRSMASSPGRRKTAKPGLWGIPSWGLALLTMFLAFVVLMIIGDIVGQVFNIPEDTPLELVFYILYNLVIAAGCFLICRNDPPAVFYAPVLANLLGIFSAIVERNFWTGGLWIVICGGWLVSIVAAVLGSLYGRKRKPNLLPVLVPWILISSMQGGAQSLEQKKASIPRIDLHVHLTNNYASTPSLRYEKAAAQSAAMGVVFGVAEELESPDVNLVEQYFNTCLALARKHNLYVGLQLSRHGALKYYPQKVLDSVDYVMEDAMIFPDKNGRTIFLWTPGVTIADPEEFMDRYVEYNLRVLSDPIDIWVNPTYLPIKLQPRYNELWTEARMKRLIGAAVRNHIAIEINSVYKLPGESFIRMAKAAGAKFTIGTNAHDKGIGEISWSLETAAACGLTREDFFIPARKLPHK